MHKHEGIIINNKSSAASAMADQASTVHTPHPHLQADSNRRQMSSWLSSIVPCKLTPSACRVGVSKHLRSASSNSLSGSLTRLSTYGERAFPVSAACVWNSLPQHAITAPSLPVFCSRLKTSFRLRYSLTFMSCLQSDFCCYRPDNRFYLFTN